MNCEIWRPGRIANGNCIICVFDHADDEKDKVENLVCLELENYVREMHLECVGVAIYAAECFSAFKLIGAQRKKEIDDLLPLIDNEKCRPIDSMLWNINHYVHSHKFFGSWGNCESGTVCWLLFCLVKGSACSNPACTFPFNSSQIFPGSIEFLQAIRHVPSHRRSRSSRLRLWNGFRINISL